MTAATEVTVSCPACRDHVNTQAGTYAYARAYLCAAVHVPLWDAADVREHARGKCPHTPEPCRRCGGCVVRLTEEQMVAACAKLADLDQLPEHVVTPRGIDVTEALLRRHCVMTEGGVVHLPSNPERTSKCACGQRGMS